ncbi:MAG TPA: protein kinase [Thermoanaerobaculia bacterium]|nr:protein kinase [Thermoanaerobaculia bacterium]
MTISAGTRLGPYEILAPIGSGGMGEVFRAKDTRLDRSVAIKVLPSHLSSNPQLRERFDREARAVSALNHPNICTLHDVGHEGGIDYIVMELLEGESLADRLVKGPLPVEQVLRYGVQIAHGLDKAHRQGIVHRDLKPGNVMITKSGAKLLDFGLAKSVTGLSAMGGATDLATAQKPLTQEGTILGTFQYMAPEQLEGEEADARTDIFALGALLYEMATGQRAFAGKTRTSLIAAIVSSEPPPISQLQPLTPPALEHVIRKCLAKERDDRWQSAHDIAEELKWISEVGSQAGVTAIPGRRRHLSRILFPAISLLLLGAAITLGTLLVRERADRPGRLVASLEAPPSYKFSTIDGGPAISPDGRHVAFVARGEKGEKNLWVRPLSSYEARALPGTEDAAWPFWSPDSRFLGFFAGGKLKKVSLKNGLPEILADASGPLGGTWSEEQVIVFSTRVQSRLMKVPASGGVAETVNIESGEVAVSPWFLPGGRRLLYTSFRSFGEAEGVYVGSLDGSERKLVLAGAYSNCQYASGYLLFSRDGDLRAQPFDLKGEKTTGDAVRIADRIQYNADSASGLFSASSNGMLTYLPGGSANLSEIAWVDRQGKDLEVISTSDMYYSPRLSHDQTRIAYDLSDHTTAKGDIWIRDMRRGVTSKLTYEPANESGPLWSPDDAQIYYFSEQSGRPQIYVKPSGGVGQARQITKDPARTFPLAVSPDGKLIAVSHVDPKKPDPNIYIVDLSAQKTSPFLATPAFETDISFSPDGRWVAYTSNESGRFEVYVQNFPNAQGKWLVSQSGGSEPAWRQDGGELYYVASDRKLMAVPIKLGETFEAGAAVPLFEVHLRVGGFVRQYDVTRDGQRFLLNRTVGDDLAAPMTLVQDWTEGLRKR